MVSRVSSGGPNNTVLHRLYTAWDRSDASAAQYGTRFERGVDLALVPLDVTWVSQQGNDPPPTVTVYDRDAAAREADAEAMRRRRVAAEAKLKGPPPSLVVMLAVLRQRFELDDTAKLEEVESAAARELVGGTSQKGFTPDHKKNFARRVKAVWMAACDAKEREEEGGAAPAAAPSTSHPASITVLVDTVEPSSPPPTWSS